MKSSTSMGQGNGLGQMVNIAFSYKRGKVGDLKNGKPLSMQTAQGESGMYDGQYSQ